MAASPTIVFLAIQAGVRLYQGVQGAYVSSVRNAALTLPLPRSAPNTADNIVGWFQQPIHAHCRPSPGSALGQLLDKAEQDSQSLTEAEQETLHQMYDVAYGEVNDYSGNADAPNPNVSIGGIKIVPRGRSAFEHNGFLALTEIRQWAEGQDGAPPSGFQLVAGTLVDVAVFWFANRPGAISDQHPAGRALLAFLKGVETVPFATTAPREILGQMLVGVLETVAAEPRLVAGGQKEEALVTNVSQALAGALARRFKTERTGDEAESAASWAQLVARTMLRAGADTVLVSPALYFDADDPARSAVITDIGTAFINLVVPAVGTDGDERIDLGKLVSATGLETLVRASLAAVGEHPGAFGLGAKAGLEALIGDLATAFSKAALPKSAQAAFPDIARLVLIRTAAHVDEIWGGDQRDVGRNLLVLATRRTLETLAGLSGGKGDPVFAKTQMIDLFDTVLAEVVANPHWVITRADSIEESKVLSIALEAVLTALKGQTLGTLSRDTALGILKAALKAGGSQLALMRKIPPGGTAAGKIALEAIIDAIFAEIAKGDADAHWRLARGNALVVLVEIALGELVRVPANDADQQARIDILRGCVATIVQGEVTIDGFAQLLRTQLAPSA
jgi:hypothetical protein